MGLPNANGSESSTYGTGSGTPLRFRNFIHREGFVGGECQGVPVRS
jgi:hypothetical protein